MRWRGEGGGGGGGRGVGDGANDGLRCRWNV